MSRATVFAALLAIGMVAATADAVGQTQRSRPRYASVSNDPGCEVARLVSTGGPLPAAPTTLALRWAGYANYELVYNGQVVLLDAAFDRGSNFPPLGFTVPEVTRVNAILIGHPHADHMSDAAAIAIRTKAIVAGAPIATEKLISDGVPKQQVRPVSGRGGEVLNLPGLRIEPILGRHSVRDRSLTDPFEKVLQALSPPETAAQQEESRIIGQRGVGGPRVVDEGTITYLITLDNGFTVLFRDSAGDITEFERAAMKRLPRVDLAIVAMANAYLNPAQARKALEYVDAYRPGIFMPAHHDAPYNDLWRSTEPVFQMMKDKYPDLITVSKTYREPVCFDTARRDNGAR